ncbi:MAG: hypothetical protein GY906_39460 [bacterium]|nr:hypothetical protein [bacterium]
MRVGLILVALLLPQIGLAHPVLGEGKVIPVGRCYPDHKEPGLWWLEPQEVDLKRENGKPNALFTTFLYQGTRTTGDAGRQWGGSVLQFTLEFSSSQGRVEQARAFLGSNRRVQLMEPAELLAGVAFAGIQGVERDAHEGGPRGAESVAKEVSFSLALSPEEGVVVRSAWEAGSVILSVNVIASVFAYQTRPENDEDTPAELMPVSVSVVNVHLDPQDKDIFRVLSLDATMPADYTALDIGCSEMNSELSFSDIGRVMVIVGGEAVNGDTVTEQVRFTQRSASIQTVSFNQALKIDAGYQVSIMKVYSSGMVEEEETRRVGIWQGFVDVCSTQAGVELALDPRMLY